LASSTLGIISLHASTTKLNSVSASLFVSSSAAAAVDFFVYSRLTDIADVFNKQDSHSGDKLHTTIRITKRGQVRDKINADRC